MSVISKNPFDLLGDGDAPAAAPAPKAAAAPAPAKTQRDIPGSKPKSDDKPAGARGGRGGYPARGGPRNVLKGDKPKPAEDNAVDPEPGFEGERIANSKTARTPRAPREKGARGGKAGRGRGQAPGAGYQGGDRKNDPRRSAHAVPDTEKRIASGWGAEEGTAELTAEVEGATDAAKETAQTGTETPAAGEWDSAPSGPAADEWDAAPAAEGEAEKKPEEEVDNSKSYEEYLAEREATKNAQLGKLEGRTVEGSDELTGSAFKRAEEEFFGGVKKEKASAAKTKERKEKVFIEVEGKFAPPSRGDRDGAPRGGRGGRGGFRGGDRGSDRPRGGRGGNRNTNSNSAPAVSVNDESAFPALGA